MRGSVLGERTKFVFIAPPSMEELERRLRGRCGFGGVGGVASMGSSPGAKGLGGRGGAG